MSFGKKKKEPKFVSFEGAEFYGIRGPEKPKKSKPQKSPIDEDMAEFFGEGVYPIEYALNSTAKSALCSPYMLPALTKFVQELGGKFQIYMPTPFGMIRIDPKFITIKIDGKEHQVPPTSKGLVFFFEWKDKKFVITNMDPIDIHVDGSFEECEDFANTLYSRIIADYIKGKSFHIQFIPRIGMKFLPVDNPNVGWDDIILDKRIIEKFKISTVEVLENIDKFVKFGALPNRGIILYGHHGTGKTTLIKAALTQIYGRYSVVFMSSADILKGKFEFIYEIAAELRPCMIVIEDIDRLLMGAGSEKVITDLLSVLDGYKGLKGLITIATSNHISQIDMALRDRPGRFDTTILIPRPDNNQFKQILALNLPALQEHIMRMTFDFSLLRLNGSHAKKIMSDAFQIAMKDGRDPSQVTIVDVKGALEWLKAERSDYTRHGDDVMVG